MAFTKIVGAGIHTLSNVHTHNINSSGIITATSFVGPLDGTNGDFSGNVTIDGNLIVNGDTTTLNTTLREVEILRVDANNSTVGAAITQSGTGDILNLYDGSTEVFSVADGGGVRATAAITAHDFRSGGGVGNTLYLTSADDWRFRTTGGIERIRIKSSGEVGIGTDNPSSVLHIDKGLSGSPLVTFHQTNGSSSADAGLEVETSSTGTFVQRWVNSGTEIMRVTGNGLVGIGTDNPQEDLHIGSNSPYILLDDYDNSRKWKLKGTAWFEIEDTTAGENRFRITSDGKFSLGTINATPAAAVHIDYESNNLLMLDNATGSTQKIFFAQNAATHAQIYATSAQGSLIFDSDPSDNHNTSIIGFNIDGGAKLQIGSSGNFTFFNNAAVWNTIQRATATHYVGLRIQETDATQRMQFGVAGGANNIVNGAAQHDVVLKAYDANLILATNATERLRITSDGDINFGVQSSSTPVTSGTIKQVSLGKDYWNGDKGHYGALRLLVYDNGVNDAYGFGISNSELEIQSQGNIGIYAGTNASDSKRDRRMYIDTSGDVLFGYNTSAGVNSSSMFNMSLGGTYHNADGAMPKLSLWHDGTDHMGFGVSSNQLDYILTSSSYDHVFYGGNSGTTELLRIKGGTGSVGIGTDNPTAPLHILSSSTGLKVQRGNESFSVNANYGGQSHCAFELTNALSIRTGSGAQNERFRITSDGKVGIKQSSPYADLDITSSVEDSDTGTLSEHGIRLSHVGAADEEVIPITAAFKTQQDRARAGIGFISKTISGTDGLGGAIGFYTRNSADGTALRRADERVRIHENGRVTIGDSDATPAGTYGLLHLYQASNDPYMIIQNGGAGDSGVDLGGIAVRNSTNQQTMIKTYQANINTANIHFYTNYAGSFADRFLMESTGTFAINGNVTDEKLVLSGSSQPYIRWREGNTNKAYMRWNNAGYLGLYNQEDGSVLRLKDSIDFSKDGSTFYGVHHGDNYGHWGENYTAYFVGTNTSDTSTIDEQKVRFYKVSIDGVSNYGGVNYVDIVRAGVHDNNGLHGMWVGSMDVRIKCRFSNCGNGSAYGYIVHNYHSNTSSVTQGQGGGNIARLDTYLACTESSRLYVWLRGQLTYYIRVNGRPASIYAIDMNDYRTTMHSSVMPAGWDGEARDALSIYWGYQGQSGAGRKLFGTSGGVEAQGNVSATGSKPFKIPHPLVGLSTTKNLVHAAIEGPQCDNIYRGKTTLVAGISTVNIDTNAGMTDGTFATLNRDVQCFTTNETGWTPIKGSVSGNQLTILAQDNSCTDTISWMVVGERQDDNIVNNTMTDSQGHLIVEPDFEEIVEPDDPGTFAAGSSQIGEDGSDRTFTQPLST